MSDGWNFAVAETFSKSDDKDTVVEPSSRLEFMRWWRVTQQLSSWLIQERNDMSAKKVGEPERLLVATRGDRTELVQ